MKPCLDSRESAAESSDANQYRLAVLASHPIQYQAPLFRALARSGKVDLHVFFCSSYGAGAHRDEMFGAEFAWDVPLLDGYKSAFLKNTSPKPAPNRFWGCINPAIGKALRQQRFDAVWIHGWSLATCWLAFRECRRLGLPILIRGDSSGLKEPRGIKRFAKRIVLERLFRRIAAFLAIGQNNADFYAAYGVPPERIFFVPFSVDNELFGAASSPCASQIVRQREGMGIDPHLPLVLFCGKFADYKRPMDLLKAFALLGDAPKASLAFVGDGPLKAEMQKFIVNRHLKRVHILGFRNQTELPACYAMADVFVLPSSEPWGLVVNEAMCSGLAVVVSNAAGSARDLVLDGVNGFVYPSGDIEALAGSLRKILRDQHLRRTMGEQSKAIIQKWGIKQTVDGILTALEYATTNPPAAHAWDESEPGWFRQRQDRLVGPE